MGSATGDTMPRPKCSVRAVVTPTPLHPSLTALDVDAAPVPSRGLLPSAAEWFNFHSCELQ